MDLRSLSLMALGGRYRTLHDRQYQWEQNRFVNPGEDFTGSEEGAAAPEGEAAGRR